MESIKFDEANLALGESQPEYNTLHAHLDPNQASKPMVFGFKLTPEELEEIAKTGEVWLEQLTFGMRFQPIGISVSKPELREINLEEWAKEQRITKNN